MDSFKNYFEFYIGNKYFSIINNDKKISFIPMSQKYPSYTAILNINNSWDVTEDDAYNDHITYYTYIYKDNVWVRQ